MTGQKYLVFLLKQLRPSIASSEMERLFKHSVLSLSFLRYIKKKVCCILAMLQEKFLCCEKCPFLQEKVPCICIRSQAL